MQTAVPEEEEQSAGLWETTLTPLDEDARASSDKK
jgi:hypothetical protein